LSTVAPPSSLNPRGSASPPATGFVVDERALGSDAAIAVSVARPARADSLEQPHNVPAAATPTRKNFKLFMLYIASWRRLD
jgi:hypothetical protein